MNKEIEMEVKVRRPALKRPECRKSEKIVIRVTAIEKELITGIFAERGLEVSQGLRTLIDGMILKSH